MYQRSVIVVKTTRLRSFTRAQQHRPVPDPLSFTPTRHAAHQTGQTHAGGPKVPSGHAWIPVRHAQRRIDTRCWWPLDGVCVGLLRRSDMFPPGRSEPAVSIM